ncbi:cation diffusion facilitator family transporter [Streptomyces sp. SP18CS02]|uniref:cation diffusion facilitator family transporter n=1 Tax=Streptomyces sp. SP18CS02 TaxID=3002531 RepID=UPI002E77200B|nr:cation diffusion facilitator family transporter [Streptomyces sp. SP18CS02]MEE1754067.1 cation diffusion facilitator family transporter [Streptomyces sp. SP18CS02]
MTGRGHHHEYDDGRRRGHRHGHHHHHHGERIDAALETSAAGLRTLWFSFAVLAATTVAQSVIAFLSGSVALLGDTVHNATDALTALPLALAFVLGRRAATRRYTYGFGRAEDLAGVCVVLVIAASAAFAGYEAVRRLLDPQDVSHLPAVAAAGLVGFAGNEWVARARIGTGRRIGSAALVADGLHARTDGFTSLAVLLGAGGSALGWRWADPLIGLAITAAILLVLRGAAREVWHRLMDAVDPALVDGAEETLARVEGVRAVGSVRMRWLGHALRAETSVVVDPALTVVQAHAVAVAAEHALLHEVPRLTSVTVHIDHGYTGGSDPHQELAHHFPAAAQGSWT